MALKTTTTVNGEKVNLIVLREDELEEKVRELASKQILKELEEMGLKIASKREETHRILSGIYWWDDVKQTIKKNSVLAIFGGAILWGANSLWEAFKHAR